MSLGISLTTSSRKYLLPFPGSSLLSTLITDWSSYFLDGEGLYLVLIEKFLHLGTSDHLLSGRRG